MSECEDAKGRGYHECYTSYVWDSIISLKIIESRKCPFRLTQKRSFMPSSPKTPKRKRRLLEKQNSGCSGLSQRSQVFVIWFMLRFLRVDVGSRVIREFHISLPVIS